MSRACKGPRCCERVCLGLESPGYFLGYFFGFFFIHAENAYVRDKSITDQKGPRERGREGGTASPACNSYRCIIRQERTEGRKHVFREEEEDLMRSAEGRKEGTAYSRWGFCRCLELRINMLIMISETMTMTAKAHYCEEKEEES